MTVAGAHPPRKLYGRRRGKRLRPRRAELIESRLPKLRVPGVYAPGSPLRAQIDLKTLFSGDREIWLEIGFGGGEHLVDAARRHTDKGFIGCEPFINGVAKLLDRLEGDDLGNVRVHPGDARDLIELLPEACLGRVYLLYPDPWPKARHAGRRFVNAGNLRELATAMRPDAQFRLATDIPGYLEHALLALEKSPDFRLLDWHGPGYAQPWPDWPGTRYEAKAHCEGRRGHYVTAIRV